MWEALDSHWFVPLNTLVIPAERSESRDPWVAVDLWVPALASLGRDDNKVWGEQGAMIAITVGELAFASDPDARLKLI